MPIKIVTTLLFSTLTALLIFGYSQNSQNTTHIDAIMQKDTVIIIDHAPEQLCQGDTLKKDIVNSVTHTNNLLISSSKDIVDCSNYNKEEKLSISGGCEKKDVREYIYNTEGYNNNCVISFDLDKEAQILDIENGILIDVVHRLSMLN